MYTSSCARTSPHPLTSYLHWHGDPTDTQRHTEKPWLTQPSAIQSVPEHGTETKPARNLRCYSAVNGRADLPVLHVIVATARDATGDLGKLVVMLCVKFQDQFVFLFSPHFVLLDGWVHVVVVSLAALLRRASWHHLCYLCPSATLYQCASRVGSHVRGTRGAIPATFLFR